MIKEVIVFLFLVSTAQVHGIKVKCDHTTPVCNCDAPQDDDTCEFNMEIQHLETFTRYELSADGGSRGTAGSVWYIDGSTGDFLRHELPAENPTCSGITEEDTSKCTEPFAVDGCTFRSFVAVNGRIPGPTLIVEKNKYVKVHVLNQLASEAISIHWHGMHQRNSHWMDGVEHVTQCGIAPGTNFTYIFQAEQSGTHWYHSHSGAQRTEGLFGALIVKEEESMLDEIIRAAECSFQDLPGEHTLTLLDWQKENSIDLFTQIHSSIRFFNEDKAPDASTKITPRTYSADGAEVGPVSYWSGLINGRGRHQSVDYIKTRLSVFTVAPDSAYRFRLVGAQSLFAYRVSIDEHELILIAMDGVLVQPKTFDYIILHSGERYDFLLKTKDNFEIENKQRNNFIIRVETLETEYEGRVPLEVMSSAEAILHYNTNDVPKSSQYESIAKNSVPVSVVCTENAKCRALNCPFKDYPLSYNISCTHVNDIRTMFPLDEKELPNLVVGETNQVFLNFGFEGARQTSAINARNMKLPSAPLGLLTSKQRKEIEEKEFCSSLDDETVCNNNANAATLPECTCTHVKEIKYGESIQMVFSATGPDPTDTTNFLFAHPVHLHGHYFHVADIQFGEYNEGRLVAGNESIDCGDSGVTNLCNVPKWNETFDYANGKTGKINAYSPRKDTILVPAGGYAVVYVKANNPGYWYLHCHIEVHQLEGMGVIISEGVNKATKAPSDMIRKCGNFSLDVKGFKKARDKAPGLYYSCVLVIIGCILVVIATTT